MPNLDHLIRPFVDSVAAGRIEVYNEFSLQHELGVFLRDKLPRYKVQFERNVHFFFPGKKTSFTKREIDITVFSLETNELKWAIELKYPRNGQYPEQMFSFCKDIAFAEELKDAGISQSGLVIFAEDHLFYRGATGGIYDFFRGDKMLHGRIQKPTGGKDIQIEVRGTYAVKWKEISDPLMYTALEVAVSE